MTKLNKPDPSFAPKNPEPEVEYKVGDILNNSQTAKLLGVNRSTLTLWHNKGTFLPDVTEESGIGLHKFYEYSRVLALQEQRAIAKKESSLRVANDKVALKRRRARQLIEIQARIDKADYGIDLTGNELAILIGKPQSYVSNLVAKGILKPCGTVGDNNKPVYDSNVVNVMVFASKELNTPQWVLDMREERDKVEYNKERKQSTKVFDWRATIN